MTRSWPKLLGAAALAAVLTAASGAQGESALFAARLDAANLDALRVRGPDADAGLGDWALGNGTLCAAVSDGAHEGHLSMQGGSLIDLGFCEGGGDQWSALQMLFNLSPSWQLPIERIEALRSEEQASIEVVAAGDGVRVSSRFVVAPEPADVLVVEQRVERVGEGPRAFAVGAVALHSTGQMRPFTLSTRWPERTRGFAHPEVDTGSILSLVRALVTADAHVLVGGDRISPALSYGILLREAVRVLGDGTREPVPTLAINGEDFTLFGAVSRPPWIGSTDPPGLLALAQMPLADLGVGETLLLEIELRLGRRADVASVRDAWLEQAPRVTGRVDDPGARIHVDRVGPAGERPTPFTQVAPESDGGFAFRAPPGAYRLRARAPGGRSLVRELRVEPEGADVGILRVGAPSVLLLPEAETMRLVFRGEGETPDPRFGGDLLGLRVGERELRAGTESSVVSLAGTARDPRQVVLAPGRYRVYAMRGPEHDVVETRVGIGPGETQALEIDPPLRAFETPGWLSADLHVHSGHSFDSSLPLSDQVRAFAAVDVEVYVATEHDRVMDPAPTIGRLGLAGRMAGLAGVEITTTVAGGESPHTIAHSNALPVPYLPEHYRSGAPRAEGRRLRDVAYELSRLDPPALFQLNHPRALAGSSNPDQYYFDHLATAGEPFEPTTPLVETPNAVLLEASPEHGLRDLDFHAMELLNGPGFDRYRQVRADWVSLWLQGEGRTGTANSDSHQAGEVPGFPRNWVRSNAGGVASLERGAFLAALHGGRLVGSTGPFLTARLGAAEVGGRFSGREGLLEIELRVAPWVPVDEVRVVVDGEIRSRHPVTGSARLELPMAFERDAVVFVEAVGEPRGVYARILPGFTPVAFTNPIVVDADGDGRVTPPGLPAGPIWAFENVRDR